MKVNVKWLWIIFSAHQAYTILNRLTASALTMRIYAILSVVLMIVVLIFIMRFGFDKNYAERSTGNKMETIFCPSFLSGSIFLGLVLHYFRFESVKNAAFMRTAAFYYGVFLLLYVLFYLVAHFLQRKLEIGWVKDKYGAVFYTLVGFFLFIFSVALFH